MGTSFSSLLILFFSFSKNHGEGSKPKKMGLPLVHALFLTLFLLCLQTKAEDFGATGKLAGTCNLFSGKWVYDASNPLYDPSTCPFIDPQFNCQKHGRSDKLYQKYRWMPFSCPLPRYFYFSYQPLDKKIKIHFFKYCLCYFLIRIRVSCH